MYKIFCCEILGVALDGFEANSKIWCKTPVKTQSFVALQSTDIAWPWFYYDFGPFLATVAACHRYILPFP